VILWWSNLWWGNLFGEIFLEFCEVGSLRMESVGGGCVRSFVWGVWDVCVGRACRVSLYGVSVMKNCEESLCGVFMGLGRNFVRRVKFVPGSLWVVWVESVGDFKDICGESVGLYGVEVVGGFGAGFCGVLCGGHFVG